jgi:hypothetical protein
MSSLALLSVVGVLAVAVLTWFFIRTRSADLLEAMMAKRRGSSRLVSRAEFVEGMDHIPVALSLNDKSIQYENSDLEARLELDRIEEVEYDDELSFGKGIEHGQVLRLRSHGHAFEFIIDKSSAAQWQTALPPHRLNDAQLSVM